MVFQHKNPSRFRRLAAASSGVVGVLLILIGGLLAYGTRAIFDSRAFANRAVASLADPRVASFVATKVTDALIEQERNLLGLRPILLATTEAVVSSAPFRVVMRRSLLESHRLILTEGAEDILLTVSDVGIILKSALAPRPDIAERLPEELQIVIASWDDAPSSELLARLLRFSRRAAVLATISFVLGVILLGLGVVTSGDIRVAIFRYGILFTVAGGLLWILVGLGGPVLRWVAGDVALGAALAGVWDAFAAGLRGRAVALGVLGLLVAATATSLVQGFDLTSMAQAVGRTLWGPLARGRSQLLRAVAAILVGVFAIARPQAALELLILAAGGVVLFIGLIELIRLALPEMRALESTAAPSTPSLAIHWRALRLGLASVAVVAILVSAGLVLTRNPTTIAAASPVVACNGMPELCNRPLDQVVFPGSHNSMSSAEDPGWLFANHERGPLAQLQDGVRAFLMDVYPGIAVGDRVKTDVDEDELIREKYEDILGPEGFDAALRIRDRLVGQAEGDSALYLCHGLCELGATPLLDILAGMRKFLVLNPGEVVIIIFEDYVTPADIEAAFQQSGLVDFVYRGRTGPPWPTLRELISSDRRVLVFAEKNSQGVAWYHQAYEVFQETPYSFHDPAEFSCAPNRGGTSGSLLLINHWISTPPSSRPSDAEVVNARDILLARAQNCWRERGLAPTVLAVDFYGTGDLLEVARALNQAQGTRTNP